MKYIKEEFHIRPGVFWCGDCPGGWVEANRKLYDYELVFFSRGRCQVTTERNTFFCGEGDVLVIPPLHEHCSMTADGCTRWCIHFDWFGDCPLYAAETLPFVYLDGEETFEPALAARLYTGITPRFPALFHFERPQAVQLLSWMRQFFGTASDSLGDSLTRQGVFLQILGQVLGHENCFASHFSKGSHFLQAKRYLDKHAGEPMLQLREVAVALLITPNHLNKLFRQNLGCSVRDYLMNRRMDKAERLLKESEQSIGQVADACGFSSANYFIRQFRKRNGLTPRAFRQNALLGN